MKTTGTIDPITDAYNAATKAADIAYNAAGEAHKSAYAAAKVARESARSKRDADYRNRAAAQIDAGSSNEDTDLDSSILA